MISAVAGVKHKPSDNEVVGASAVISKRRGRERDYRNHLVRIMDLCILDTFSHLCIYIYIYIHSPHRMLD